jgi:hypothetical protein
VAGEVAGFVAPATVGVLSANWAPWLSVPALVAAGAVEGFLLGAAQAHALAPDLTALDTRRFAVLTSVAAAVAYLVVMVPVAAAHRMERAPRAVAVLVVAVVGVVLLGSLGTAQWLELRRHLARAGSWIAVTGAAWLLGLGVFMLIATPLWHEGQSVLPAVAVGLVGALAMATTVALVTGIAVLRLVGRHGARSGDDPRGELEVDRDGHDVLDDRGERS